MLFFCSLAVGGLLILILLRHSFFVFWSIILVNLGSMGALVAVCAYRAKLSFQVEAIF
jgi:hypothetical protein